MESPFINGTVLALLFTGLIFQSTETHSQERFLPASIFGFNSMDTFEVTTSTRYDSETESDLLTYRPVSCAHQYILQDSVNFICSSLGSLGSKRFLVDHLFLFSHQINKDVSFRAHWIKDQDYSKGTDVQAAEFFYTPTPNHAIGLHGQFDTKKSGDDLGLSYNFATSDFSMRAEATAYDFSRNDRNENSDRFREKPYSLALSFFKRDGRDLYFLQSQIEPQFTWEQPASSQTIKRSRSDTQFLARIKEHILTLQFAERRIQINTIFENEIQTRAQWQKDWSATLQSGLRLAHKNWHTVNGKLNHYDLLPFVWYQPQERFRNWKVGYEFTWHTSNGDEALRSLSARTSALEHRGNLSWHLIKTDTARLDVLFTADLDRFGSGETWEGGSGQFTMVF